MIDLLSRVWLEEGTIRRVGSNANALFFTRREFD